MSTPAAIPPTTYELDDIGRYAAACRAARAAGAPVPGWTRWALQDALTAALPDILMQGARAAAARQAGQ